MSSSDPTADNALVDAMRDLAEGRASPNQIRARFGMGALDGGDDRRTAPSFKLIVSPKAWSAFEKAGFDMALFTPTRPWPIV